MPMAQGTRAARLHPTAVRRCRRLPPCASISGRPGGGGLILPGSDDFPSDEAAPRGPKPAGFGPGVARPTPDGPLYQPFRPPAAYKDTAALPKQELLNRLTARSGRWFELARALDALAAMGVTSSEVFDLTGLTPLDQNAWRVQAAVYTSLEAAAPAFPAELLTHFHDETHAASLAELRNTPVSWRPAAAALVVTRVMDVNATRELARAILDYERRPDLSRSFEATPGDALAYKYYREAGEVPRRIGWKEGVEAAVAKGLAVATSEAARAKLKSALVEEARSLVGGAEVTAGTAASVQVVRLEDEEAAFRPLPLLGSLEEVSAAAVRGAPAIATEGVFLAFKPAASATGTPISWVALPAWAKLANLTTAVAVSVRDTTALAAVAPAVASTPGPALLVIDRAETALAPEHFFLISQPASSLLVGAGGRPLPPTVALSAGSKVGKEATVLGRLALVVRPAISRQAAPRNLPPGLQDLGVADEGEDDEAAPQRRSLGEADLAE